MRYESGFFLWGLYVVIHLLQLHLFKEFSPLNCLGLFIMIFILIISRYFHIFVEIQLSIWYHILTP